MTTSTMTATEILQAMVAADGYIQVLRGPTAEYITVCWPDGTALLAGDLPRSILDGFLAQSYVEQGGVENDKRKTVFRLTTDGKKAGA
jgi:hypothetical protein